MNENQAELLRRLHEFPLDDPSDARPFSLRLAQEQGWSAAFAARAIEEYLRFVVLAVTTSHSVCPSDQVDEVWHLHLLYTRNYWQRFCADVLKCPLHHDPSRGGPNELAKHRQMYAQTLDAYRQTFGSEPPPDLWPALDRRFGRHAIRPEKSPGRDTISAIGRQPWPWVAVAGGSLSLLPLMNPSLVAAVENPLDLAGPEFLTLYLTLFGVALGVGVCLRYWARRRDTSPAIAKSAELDSYEAAYLAGGTYRAINAAVAQLVHTNRLRLQTASPPTFTQSDLNWSAAHPFEREIAVCFESDLNGELLRVAHQKGDSLCARLVDRLRDLGLIVSQGNDLLGRVAPMAFLLFLAAFGAVKVVVGLSRGRPVLYLVMACIVTVLVAVLGFGRRLHRTPAGDRELAALQARFAKLRDTFASPDYATTGAQFPLALGLFGMGLLATTPLNDLSAAFNARGKTTSGFWGVGCATGGCGGAGAGCGGGGGGCGGGGGGCGGCSGH